jgi:hypothetical protein
VNNYKIILKAVGTIESMMNGNFIINTDAKNRNVQLDDLVIETVNKEK